MYNSVCDYPSLTAISISKEDSHLDPGIDLVI